MAIIPKETETLRDKIKAFAVANPNLLTNIGIDTSASDYERFLTYAITRIVFLLGTKISVTKWDDDSVFDNNKKQGIVKAVAYQIDHYKKYNAQDIISGSISLNMGSFNYQQSDSTAFDFVPWSVITELTLIGLFQRAVHSADIVNQSTDKIITVINPKYKTYYEVPVSDIDGFWFQVGQNKLLTEAQAIRLIKAQIKETQSETEWNNFHTRIQNWMRSNPNLFKGEPGTPGKDGKDGKSNEYIVVDQDGSVDILTPNKKTAAFSIENDANKSELPLLLDRAKKTLGNIANNEVLQKQEVLDYIIVNSGISGAFDTWFNTDSTDGSFNIKSYNKQFDAIAITNDAIKMEFKTLLDRSKKTTAQLDNTEVMQKQEITEMTTFGFHTTPAAHRTPQTVKDLIFYKYTKNGSPWYAFLDPIDKLNKYIFSWNKDHLNIGLDKTVATGRSKKTYNNLYANEFLRKDEIVENFIAKFEIQRPSYTAQEDVGKVYRKIAEYPSSAEFDNDKIKIHIESSAVDCELTIFTNTDLSKCDAKWYGRKWEKNSAGNWDQGVVLIAHSSKIHIYFYSKTTCKIKVTGIDNGTSWRSGSWITSASAAHGNSVATALIGFDVDPATFRLMTASEALKYRQLRMKEWKVTNTAGKYQTGSSNKFDLGFNLTEGQGTPNRKYHVAMISYLLDNNTATYNYPDEWVIALPHTNTKYSKNFYPENREYLFGFVLIYSPTTKTTWCEIWMNNQSPATKSRIWRIKGIPAS